MSVLIGNRRSAPGSEALLSGVNAVSVPEKWVERAQYDLETARAMLASGRYLYVLFCGQQAVEKAIKAIIALRTGEMPPRIHPLVRLAEKAGLTLDEPRKKQFLTLTSYYFESRYPDDIAALSTQADRAKAEGALRTTEEILEWLWTLMK